MKNLESIVHEVVLEIVREKTPSVTQVGNHQSLNADLGLKSLDLARIVANLEMALEADPFAELVSITSVRTVGDLLNAYRRFFDNEQAPAAQEELEEGRSRARARQEALSGIKRGRRGRALLDGDEEGGPDAS